MSNKGAPRRPAAGYAPGSAMMGTVDFEKRRARSRKAAKAARLARRKQRHG